MECRICKKDKPESDFEPNRRQCKACRRKPTPHARRDEKRRSAAIALGVSVSTYVEWVSRDCDVCGAEPTEERSNSVYKSPASGKPVGTICKMCVTGLGYLGHDVDQLRRAVELLTREPLSP
jgi:hypothetical protein